jgi:hypothetical protein
MVGVGGGIGSIYENKNKVGYLNLSSRSNGDNYKKS